MANGLEATSVEEVDSEQVAKNEASAEDVEELSEDKAEVKQVTGEMEQEKQVLEENHEREKPAEEGNKSRLSPQLETPKADAAPESRPESLAARKSSNVQREFKKTGWMRHYVAVLALFGIVLANMNRQAFNQALIKMAKKQSKPLVVTEAPTNLSSTITSASSTTSSLGYDGSTVKSGDLGESETFTPTLETTQLPTVISSYNPNEDRFDWSSQEIGWLQSAFSYGYIPLMVFSARISELYGAKWVIFISGFGSAICCISSPLVADSSQGFLLLIMSRVLMGLSQTGVAPALYALLVCWLPPEEASVYLPMMKVGATLGFTFGSLIAGFFTWRKTFYIVGGIGFLWSIIWPLTVDSNPKQSKLIKKEELNYINQEIKQLTKNRKQSAASARNKSAPWLYILLHPVVLVFMLTKLTNKISTDAQTQQFGMYLDAIFELSDDQNGMLNGCNYAIQALFTGLVAYGAQRMVMNKTFGMSKTGVRRLFQGICNFGMGLAYILITFNVSSLWVVCAAYYLLSISAMFGAGGEAVLPIDLTTDYAATIMSIANLTANLSGITLPRLVAAILGSDRANNNSWNLIWWIVGSIMIAGGVAFTTVARAELLDFEHNRLIDFVSSLYNFRRKKVRISEKGEKADKSPSVVIQMEEINTKN